MTCYQLGCWRYDPVSGELGCGCRSQRLEPRVADVLTLLASRAGEVVTRNEILDAVWHGRVVVDESITRCISMIRKTLSDHRPYRFVETLPKRGYRVRATRVTCHPLNGAPEPHPASDVLAGFEDLDAPACEEKQR